MAQVQLGITISMDEADVERLRRAFGRRLGNPDIPINVVLAALKMSAIDQIGNVIVSEEQSALDEQKHVITPPVME